MSYAKVKNAYTIAKGEKLCCVISLGYGKTHGTPHKSKSLEEVAVIKDDTPEWFINGVSDMDLGIVKYHFEIGSGKEFFKDEMKLA